MVYKYRMSNNILRKDATLLCNGKVTDKEHKIYYSKCQIPITGHN